ncbi:MAG: helix-hairpin-helix domain-containing protein [Defluviitaleaceae bacterium]|nr:helix-hairpin-helix domain-containing protein [Defluviitaleaceae bacterium]
MLEKLRTKLKIKSPLTMKLLFFGAIGVIALFAALYINEQRNTPMVLVGMDVDTRGYATEGGRYSQDEEPAEPQVIKVSISGEVYNPGLFAFYEGARIYNVVEAAGGLTQYADRNAISLAARIVDEQHIIIFSLADNAPPAVTASGGAAGIASDGRVNINTATSEQLQTLSGIGRIMAADIISHREARGGFATIEEIKNVRGIGDITFENLRDRITVD